MASTKREFIKNELGQKVRVYDWNDVCKRIELRKYLAKDTDLNGKTLVVKHTWGLGDILYSTPAIHRLKEKFPTCTIIYTCIYPEILEGNPDIDRVIHYMDENAYADFVDEIETDWYFLDYDTPLKGGFDYKFHLRTKPMLNEYMTKLLRQDVDSLNTDEKDFINQASSSVIQRYKMIALDMYCAHAFCDEPETKKTVFYYPKSAETELARRFLKPLKDRYRKVITLMPHASTPYKDYPYWHDVVKLCPANWYWLILDSRIKPDETWASPNVFNLAGALQTRQTIALIMEADLNCSSDTGMLYPRAAVGRPTIVVYGPHEPEPFLHYFPSAKGLRVPYVTGLLDNNAPSCTVGCYIDTMSCHAKGQPAPCLQQLSPERVANEIKEMIIKYEKS